MEHVELECKRERVISVTTWNLGIKMEYFKEKKIQCGVTIT